MRRNAHERTSCDASVERTVGSKSDAKSICTDHGASPRHSISLCFVTPSQKEPCVRLDWFLRSVTQSACLFSWARTSLPDLRKCHEAAFVASCVDDAEVEVGGWIPALRAMWSSPRPEFESACRCQLLSLSATYEVTCVKVANVRHGTVAFLQAVASADQHVPILLIQLCLARQKTTYHSQHQLWMLLVQKEKERLNFDNVSQSINCRTLEDEFQERSLFRFLSSLVRPHVTKRK